MAIDDALAERARQMWIDVRPSSADAAVPARRVQMDAMFATFPVPGDVEVEAVDADGVPCDWVAAPGADPARSLIHYHGGGYAVGSAAGYHEFAYRMSQASGARVLVVDYRLLPENPISAVHEDGITAYRWLTRRIDPTQIVAVGDSAGGGLAMAVVLMARDAGDPLPAAIALISPLIDLSAGGDSHRANAGRDVVISRPRVLNTRKMVIGDGRPEDHPLASPLHADLHGLPPVFVTVGGSEVLLDDARRLADKVAAAGGEAELDVVEDMQHIFPVFASFLPEGRMAIERIGRFARDRMASRP